jgi:thiamine biosynthesis lipoprotein
MGTGVTVDIPGAAAREVFDKVFARLKDIDNRFSTYRKDSEASRYARGELRWWRMSRELRKIIKACKAAEEATDGAFSAWATGKFDPSGYVKGWAIAETSKIIEKAGFKTYCISIGGDINARGDKVWKIGLQDPKDKKRSFATLNIQDSAVATSGNYVRGAHIINPKTAKPADKLAAITVVGPNIIDADVLATAAFVLGDFAVNFIGGQAKGYEALAIHKNGRMEMTSGFEKYAS